MQWRRWLGVILIGMAGIWFAGMFVVGFLPLPAEWRWGLGLACFILMEVSFWLGTLIIGKQVVARWWRRWRKKPEPDGGGSQKDRQEGAESDGP